MSTMTLQQAYKKFPEGLADRIEENTGRAEGWCVGYGIPKDLITQVLDLHVVRLMTGEEPKFGERGELVVEVKQSEQSEQSEQSVRTEPRQVAAHTQEPAQQAQAAPNFESIARGAASRGEPHVVPIAVGGKNPVFAWKNNADPAFNINPLNTEEMTQQVEGWIKNLVAGGYENYNAAAIARPDNNLFIDDDAHLEFVSAYEAWSGEKFPRTYSTSARNNRWQLHYRQTDKTRALGNVAQMQIDGLDFSVRQSNEYVLAEGSIHKNGVDVYRCVDSSTIVPMPDKLVEFVQYLAGGKSKSDNDDKEPPRNERGLIPVGSIHNYMLSEAGSLRNKGLDADEIYPMLSVLVHKNCETPPGGIDEDKVKAMAKSICSFPEGKPGIPLAMGSNAPGAGVPATSLFSTPATAPATGEASDEIVLRCFDDIEAEEQEWLWPGHIPIGALAIFAGDPETGKTTAALDMIARVTRGDAFPDGSPNDFPPSVCLLAEAEDSASKTLKARLKGAGADTSKVHEMKFVKPQGGGQARMMQLNHDLDLIERTIRKNPEIRLLVISPLSSYLGDGVKAIDDGAVRAVVTSLQEMAARLDIAIIAIMHLNKSSDYDVIYRISGAMGFVAVARAVWLFCKDPRDPAKGGSGSNCFSSGENDKHPIVNRLMLQVKNNLEVPQPGISYQITTSPEAIPVINRRKGTTSFTYPSVIKWGETAWVKTSDILKSSVNTTGKKDRLDEAKQWLIKLFYDAEGKFKQEVGMKEYRKARHGTNLPENTLKRAKIDLGIDFDNQKRVYYFLSGDPNANTRTLDESTPSPTDGSHALPGAGGAVPSGA